MRIFNQGSIKAFLKGRLHHIVFAVSLLAMSMLLVWWSYFLYTSVEQNHASGINTLKLEMANLILHMGNEKGSGERSAAMIENNPRFEIREGSPPDQTVSMIIPGLEPPRFLTVKQTVLNEFEKDLKSKRLMVIGESGLLALIVFAGIIFLFKFINLEKRTTREMEEFWGRISHEIKTPITGIRAFLESLAGGAIDPESLPGFIDLALKETERQQKLAENILTGSSIKDPVRLKPEPFDLRSFIRDYFSFHFVSLSRGSLVLNIGDAGALNVRADRDALKIILDNITDNAGKYCPPGFELKVTIGKSAKYGWVDLADNGPGFNEACSSRIFEAYRHMDPELPDTHHGTGMGLYISKTLAVKMGGDIEAASEGKGRGSVFRVILPLEK